MLPYFEQPSFSLGPITIHAFGILVALAVFTALWLGQKRFIRQGLDTVVGERLAWWTVISGFLGAHLFALVFYHPRDVVADPLSVLRVWENISSFGGILGGIIGIWLFLRYRASGLDEETRWKYLDVAAFVFPVALCIGRLGCTLAHDHPGTITTFPLAISLESEAARVYIVRIYDAAQQTLTLKPGTSLASMGFHDLGWYELLYLGLVVVPAVWVFDKKRRSPGWFLVAFFVLYMPARFLLDFLRVGDARYAGLTPAQWVALAALAAVPFIVLRTRRFPAR